MLVETINDLQITTGPDGAAVLVRLGGGGPAFELSCVEVSRAYWAARAARIRAAVEAAATRTPAPQEGDTITIRSIGGRVLFRSTKRTMKEAVREAILVGASLDGASLDGASLDGASLDGAILDGAILDGASLVGASLVGARLVGASLVGARLDGASLVGARLDGAILDGASLDGASLDGASLDGASLVGASLDGASLVGARLDPIKEDLFDVLAKMPAEVPGVLALLRAGRINGSVYEGECACLVGSGAKVRGCAYTDIPGLKPDSDRYAERWFMALRPGHTPANNPIAKITEAWFEEWLAAHAPTERAGAAQEGTTT